jgi:hypothetical protein
MDLSNPQEETGLIVIDQAKEVSITKFEAFNNVQEQLDYANLLIAGGLVPFKRPEQVVTIANLGRALGISFEVAVQNIHSIQGRPALSVNMIMALAKKAGIDWEIKKDAVKEEVNGKMDIITEITFYRYNDKLKRVMENTFNYKWSDAQQAGYTSKDNWKTKTRNMLRARCLTEGLRFVASDVLMGVFYEQGEMLDATNQVFDVDDEGNVILPSK